MFPSLQLVWSILVNWWASLVAQMVKHLSAVQETRVWSLGWEDPLEKEMATHSSTLAWKIPWTEEPGRLQSMGSWRVGHNWVTSLSLGGGAPAKSLQSCLTLCNPSDCSPPGFSVHGILQARTLEWIVIPFSRGTSQPRDQTLVSCITGRFFTIWATGKS